MGKHKFNREFQTQMNEKLRLKSERKIKYIKVGLSLDIKKGMESMERRGRNLEGQKFKNFTVLELSEEKSERGTRKWRCQCICGNIRYILASELKREKGQKSCGCIAIKNIRKARTTHGMSNTRLYSVWEGMKRRCMNSNSTNYKYYGGRGIKICEEWLKFEGFMEWSLANGYDDKLSIDRIDGNRNYEPSNCRWTTKGVQANNRSNSIKLCHEGEYVPISFLADKYEIPNGTLRARVNAGWSVEKSINTPLRKKNQVNEKDFGRTKESELIYPVKTLEIQKQHS